MRVLAVVILVVGLMGGLTSCGQDYCDAVTDHQSELTDITSSGSPAALLKALPVFRDLADGAPDDIADDWKTFLDSLAALDQALRAAGVDPASYDRLQLPDGVDDADKQRIDAAAKALADPAVTQAFDGVQQQAKDVCHTPLSI